MRISMHSITTMSLVALLSSGLMACSAPAGPATPAPVATSAPAATSAPVETAAPVTSGAPAVTPAGTVTPAAPSIGAAPAAAARTPAVRTPAALPAAPISAPGSVPAEPPAAAPAPRTPPAPVFTEVTVPSGTTLAIELKTSHSADTSRVEETVRGVLRRAVLVDGVEVVPAGAAVTGHITAADRAGRVKGRARLALRFSSVVIDDADTAIATAAIAREAAGTKKEDAAKIGIGAGAGAVIGAIAGGKKGAVVGGAVGAGAGTGVVLATRGDDVALAAGTSVSATLSRPLVVRVRVP